MTDFNTSTDRFEGLTEEQRARAKAAEPGGGGGPNSKYFGGGQKKEFHLLGTDLFGNEAKVETNSKIRERFDFPPFTVLNAREGAWQDRKRAWLACGIQSEVGRGENLLKMSDTLIEPDPEKRAAMQAARGTGTYNDRDWIKQKGLNGLAQDAHVTKALQESARRGGAKTFGSGGPGDLAAGFKRIESASAQGLTLGITADAYRKEGEEVDGAGGSGTSIFDPVLTEMCYRWFCPVGGQIVDPFAGGSVRGVVAGLLGFKYHGIDLRPEQIAANEAQRQLICPDAPINWVVGDSNLMLPEAPPADMVFSCPPYFSLEKYSDEPDDLSNMTWNQFVKFYMSIIQKAVDRMKPNTFAVFVVGEVRDPKTGTYVGLVPLTCAAFMKAGAHFYNEAILVTAVGSLPIRVTKQFESTRKLGRTHQNVLCFVKGDPKIAASNIQIGPASLDALPPIVIAPRQEPLPPPALQPWPKAAEIGPESPVLGPIPPTPAFAPIAQVPAIANNAMAFAEAALPPAAPAPSPQSPTQAIAPTGALSFAAAAPIPQSPTRAIVTGTTLADFLGTAPLRSMPEWKPQEPPSLAGIDDIILNYATTGLNWAGDDEPVGVTISTLDGQLRRFLPFGFRGGGNLDKDQVIRFLQTEVRGKHILNSKTKFDVHMSRKLGVDLEEQGNTVSDIQHWAALLDDHRKRFALDILAKELLGGVEVERVDERQHSNYAAADVAARELYTVKLVADLRERMWPEIQAQDLEGVLSLENDVIYPVVEMEKNGALLDMELVDQYSAECVSRHGALMLEISNEAGFSFDHTTAGWQRLFEHCGLTPSEDGYSEKITGAVDHPLIRKASYAKQISQLNSKTFAAYKKSVNSEGLLRYEINQLANDDGGTVTGRFSIGYVQQVPNAGNHKLVFGDEWYPRRVYKSATELYLEADASQIEYRFFAHFAENPTVLAAYEADPWTSFHKQTQSMLVAYKPDMLYEHTKNYNFATMYGAKMIKLAVMMGFITEREGEEIRQAKRWDDPRLSLIKEIENAYKRIMPEKDMLLDKAAHLAKPRCDDYCKKNDRWHREFEHRGYVKTIDGRRSRFREWDKTYIALNRVLQGSAAGYMKRKLVELHKCRKETGLLMRMTVHDSVTGDAQEGTLEKVREILNQQSYPQLKVKILWACGVGRNWAECKG